MALRDKIRTRTRPTCSRASRSRRSCSCRRGPRPGWAAWGGIVIRVPVLTGTIRYQTLVLTDQALLVLENNWLNRPKGLVARVDRRTPTTAPQGKVWGKPVVGESPLNVHRRFFKDLEQIRARTQQPAA